MLASWYSDTCGNSNHSVRHHWNLCFFAFGVIKSVCWERLAQAGLGFSVSLCHQCLAVFHPTAASCKCCQAGCEQRVVVVVGGGFHSSAWLWAGLRGLAVRVKVSAGVCPGKCSQ